MVGLERLVEAERLRLDSAQHGPLAEAAGDLPGAQRREGSMRQESEVVAASIPWLPSRHPAYDQGKKAVVVSIVTQR